MPNPGLAPEDTEWSGKERLSREEYRALHQQCREPCAFGKDFPEECWKGWLLEWEERQRAELKQHEQTTQELLEALRKEVMDRLGQRGVRRSAVGAMGVVSPRAPRAHFAPDTESPRLEHSASKEKQEASFISEWSWRSSNQVRQGSKNPGKTSASLESALWTLAAHNSECSHQLKRKHGVAGMASHVPRGAFRWVRHPNFTLASSLFIACYTVAVGYMADAEMKASIQNEEVPKYHFYVDIAFTSVFGLEVLLRVLADGKHFITGKEWGWNVFDLSVAFACLLDVLSVFRANLGFLRILRTFRAIRVLRIVRVFPVFKELRLMVASICACMVSLTWAFTLLLGVMYIFAVVLLKGSSDYLQNNDAAVELRKSLAGDFGSLPLTIYSLTQAVSGGRSWGEYAQPFIQISAWYGVCFVAFVVFVIFGVVNILTGLFVESTSAVASFDKELVLQEEMSKNESVVNQIRQLFKELDNDKSGSLTYAELQKSLDDPRVKAYFSHLQMDVSAAEGLFQLLDKDESGEVSIEEFIMSCMRLKGAARSIDLASMLFENKKLYTMMRTFMTSIEEIMKELREKIALLHL